MTFINLAPDANGVENIARAFREGIEEARRKAARAQALIEGDLDRYDIYQPELGMIEEGLWLVVNQEEGSIVSMNEALAECELVIEANRVLLSLSGMENRLEFEGDKGEADRMREAIGLIGRLAKKAGMKA